MLILAGVSAFTTLFILQVQQGSPLKWYNREMPDDLSCRLAFTNTDPSAQRLQNVFNAVCAQLVNRFALDPVSEAKKTVTITFSWDLASAVKTSGSTITINAHWIGENPTQIGILTHELAQIVQAYPAGVPDWWSSGMADYARSIYGPADDDWSLPDEVQPHQSYRQGGAIAARFLRWLELHSRPDIVDQLNHALQRRESFSTVLGRLTHDTVDHLWSQYQAQPAITPTPEQRYQMATSGKPLYRASSLELRGQFYYRYAAGLSLSNFAMQADITILSGDPAAGFFFRDNGTDGCKVYLYASGNYALDSVYQSQRQPGPLTFSSAIKVGLKQTNRLTIIVEKSSIYLYINGQFITKVEDHRLVSYGTLGVRIQDTAGTFPEVQFDHVQVF
jgi:hypothetical protein